MSALWRIFRLILRDQKTAMMRGAALSLVVLVAGIALLGLSGWFITAAAAAGLAGVGAVFDVFRPAAMVRFLALGRTAARYGERLLTHDATLRALTSIRGACFIARHRLGGMMRAPTLLLSASMTTGREGSRSAIWWANTPSNIFCEGCPPARAPKADPRWLAAPSRSKTCTPRPLRHSNNSVFAVPVLPSSKTTGQGKGVS